MPRVPREDTHEQRLWWIQAILLLGKNKTPTGVDFPINELETKALLVSGGNIVGKVAFIRPLVSYADGSGHCSRLFLFSHPYLVENIF